MFIAFIISAFVFCVFSSAAECNHDFKAEADKSNLRYNEDYTHSFYCRNDCGEYGTQQHGPKGKEACDFVFASEIKSGCLTNGKRIFMCTYCFRNKEEIIRATGHRCQKLRVLPTCTRKGYDLFECKECNYTYTDNYVQQLKHFSDGGVIEIMPAYDRDGVLKISCRVCGYLIKKERLSPIFKPVIKAEKVSGFKVSSYTSSSVKLKWNKSKGALSYTVSYSTDKKKWKNLTTAKNSLSIEKLNSSKTYYFRIRSNGEENKSGYSKVISVCTKPEKAVLLSAVSDKKSVAVLKWKKQKNVSGYEISYTSDSFEKKKTIKVAEVVSGNKKTLKKLKSGKKYRFRIRAFKKVGSSKIFGSYSSVKSLTVK